MSFLSPFPQIATHGSMTDAGSRTVVIVVFDDATMLDVAGAGEVFTEANRFGAHYRISVASIAGRDVTTSIGTRLGVTIPLTQSSPPTPCWSPAATASSPRDRSRTRRRGHVDRGPDATAGVDLYGIVRAGLRRRAGCSVARWLVVYLKRAGGQSQLSALVESVVPPQSPLRAATDAISATPAADHGVPRLAARASLSTRQLTRLFKSELGTTPARYVERVRIDAARAALDAGHSAADAARVAELESGEPRRTFVEQLGVALKAHRERFRTASRG